jgi:hypothetical protein
MSREVHVRFCEGLWGKFPRSTRPLNFRDHRIEMTCIYDLESSHFQQLKGKYAPFERQTRGISMIPQQLKTQ